MDGTRLSREEKIYVSNFLARIFSLYDREDSYKARVKELALG